MTNRTGRVGFKGLGVKRGRALAAAGKGLSASNFSISSPLQSDLYK